MYNAKQIMETHVLRKEGDKYFIYFSNVKLPEIEDYCNPSVMSKDRQAEKYRSDYKQWFLSCEQKGNKVEVAKDGHTSDIVNYVRSITPNGNIEEIIDQVNSDGLLIPLCYEVRAVEWNPLTNQAITQLAYFKEPEHEHDYIELISPKHGTSIFTCTQCGKKITDFKEPENDGRANDRTIKKPSERTDADLLELVCQLHSRAINQPHNKLMHDYYVEAREEMDKRLSDRSEDRSSLKEKNFKLQQLHICALESYKEMKEENEKLTERLNLSRKENSSLRDHREKQQQEIERLRGDLALANGWISVDDALPTEHKRYLCLVNMNGCYDMEEVICFDKESQRWLSHLVVKKWMPLPSDHSHKNH